MPRCRIVGESCKAALSLARLPAVWIPATVLVGLTLVFRLTDIDTAWLRPFFAGVGAGEQLTDRWPSMDAQPWKALYDWGVYPAWILGCGGMAVWIASFFWSKLESWRDPGLFYALLLIVGPGLLVNVLLKPCWSRPRPHATVPFGGDRQFVPVWDLGSGQDDSSFPSGHAAMGFYLMAPAVVFYRRRPRLALAFLLLGLTSGSVIGLARMVAGSHFPSDVLWSGGFIYFTALLIAAPFGFWRESGGRNGRDGSAIGKMDG